MLQEPPHYSEWLIKNGTIVKRDETLPGGGYYPIWSLLNRLDEETVFFSSDIFNVTESKV